MIPPILFKGFYCDPRNNSLVKCNLRRSLLLYSICLYYWYTPSLPFLSTHSLWPGASCWWEILPCPFILINGYEQMWCMLWKRFHNSSQPLAFAPCHKNSMPRQGLHLHTESKTEKIHSRGKCCWTLTQQS